MMIRRASFFILSALLAACHAPAPDPQKDDTQTFGEVLMLADEDFRDIVEDQRRTFEAIYERTQLRIRYLPERELTTAMLSDSVRLVFAGFLPGAEQVRWFKSRGMSPHVEAIATDGIAVLVNPAAPFDTISLAQLRAILGGNAAESLAAYKAIFNGSGSGAARTLVDSLFHGDAGMLKNASAVANTEELLARVASDPTAIGFFSYSLLCDLDDPTHRARRSGVELLAVAGSGPAVALTQSNLADGSYPLRRSIRMLVVETKSGLGTGFASFAAGHKGQRILLKRGLAPAHIPTREVELIAP